MQYTSLSNENITQVVDELEAYLASSSLPKDDAIRTSFAMEEALLYYQATCGEETPFTFTCGKKWGKGQFALTIRGVALNPFDAPEDTEGTLSILQTLMGKMGLFPTWTYASGKNVISMVLPKVSSSPLKKLALSMIAAVLVYGITLLCPPSVAQWLYTYGVIPLSEVFTGILSAVSGPIIFFSIACSISGMGDISTFGKIGKHTISRLIGATALMIVIGCGWLVFLYPPLGTGTSMSTDSSAFFEIYEMLLAIIPSNLLSPFVSSDPMQIVALAIITGVSLLVLQKKVPELSVIVEESNSVLQYVMEHISDQIHLFVFLSVLGLLLSNQITMLLDAYLLLIYLLITLLVAIIVSVGRACLKTHTSPSTLLKKMAPTFLLAFATASSAAAFSTNLKTCKESLGISPKLSDFGVPFGQVVYMPAFALFFGVLGFYMYDAYDLSITIPMILMLFFLCIILSIALPPIPGGALIVVNILFLQLGIPDAGLTLAIIFLTIYDFPATAFNLSSLQIELLCIAKNLDLLDDSKLKGEKASLK